MGVEPRPRAVSADSAELERLYLAMLRIRLFEDAALPSVDAVAAAARSLPR